MTAPAVKEGVDMPTGAASRSANGAREELDLLNSAQSQVFEILAGLTKDSVFFFSPRAECTLLA